MYSLSTSHRLFFLVSVLHPKLSDQVPGLSILPHVAEHVVHDSVAGALVPLMVFRLSPRVDVPALQNCHKIGPAVLVPPAKKYKSK